MANISLTRVNQKLAQVRALLAGIDENNLTPIQHNSFKEAAAFHLVCAYQHYLREIGETYGLKFTANIRTELELTDAFHAGKKHPAEAEELMTLRKNADSWLHHLHTYYETLWSLPVMVSAGAQPSEEESDASSVIKLINIDPGFVATQVDIPLILSWHQNFVDLVQRQRQTSAEF